MECPKCRCVMVSGNAKGEHNGGRGKKFMKCKKCGYTQPITKVKNGTPRFYKK